MRIRRYRVCFGMPCGLRATLDRSWQSVHPAYESWIDLRPAVIGVEPVDLLLDVIELCIAEGTDAGVLEQCSRQSFISRQKLALAARAVAIAQSLTSRWCLVVLAAVQTRPGRRLQMTS